jgi:hypothetical protein
LAQDAARKHGLTVAEVEKRLELALAGMENQLLSCPHDDKALKDERIKQLERKVGQSPCVEGLVASDVPHMG